MKFLMHTYVTCRVISRHVAAYRKDANSAISSILPSISRAWKPAARAADHPIVLQNEVEVNTFVCVATSLDIGNNVQGRAAIDSFVANMDGDRARRTKWNGLAAELDAELKIVKVGFRFGGPSQELNYYDYGSACSSCFQCLYSELSNRSVAMLEPHAHQQICENKCPNDGDVKFRWTVSACPRRSPFISGRFAWMRAAAIRRTWCQWRQLCGSTPVFHPTIGRQNACLLHPIHQDAIEVFPRSASDDRHCRRMLTIWSCSRILSRS